MEPSLLQSKAALYKRGISLSDAWDQSAAKGG
jgi:hypothetical protein